MITPLRTYLGQPQRQKVLNDVAAADYGRGDYAAALRTWQALAEQGNAPAQFSLGVMYDKGQGVPQDYKAAVQWYRRAAEQGHAVAQFNLGVMYVKETLIESPINAIIEY